MVSVTTCALRFNAEKISAVRRLADPLVPRVIPGREVLGDLVFGEEGTLHHSQGLLEQPRSALGHRELRPIAVSVVEPGDCVGWAGGKEPLPDAADDVDLRQGSDIAGATLQHSDVRTGLLQRRDQRDGSGTRAYDDDPGTVDVRVVRPFLRVEDLSGEVLLTGEVWSESLVMGIVTGRVAHPAGVDGTLPVVAHSGDRVELLVGLPVSVLDPGAGPQTLGAPQSRATSRM